MIKKDLVSQFYFLPSSVIVTDLVVITVIGPD